MRSLRPALAAGLLLAASAGLVACGPARPTAGAAGSGASGSGAAGSGAAASAAAGSGAGTSGAVAARTAAAPGAAADWATYGGNPSRSGLAVGTPTFRGHLARRWTAHLDGDVYAQPLVVGGRVIVATENDSVYALAAGSGRLLWRRHLAAPVTTGLPCGDVSPSGITGTPVADVTSGRLFVTTFTASGGYHHTLWALDLTNGATVWRRPIDVPGSDPRAQQQRSALTLLGGRVYVAYGGLYGDCSDYKGRVAALPESGRGRLISFTAPVQREAAIWAPPGPVTLGGNLYVATGNGTPYRDVADSDSVVRLTAGLRQTGRFTPGNFATLSANDLDLGSTSPAVLPGGLLFQAGKEGTGYLLRAGHLGGTGGQIATVDLGDGAFGGDAVAGDTVFVACFQQLAAVRLTTGAGRRPALRVVWRAPVPAGPPVLAGGVVWDVTRQGRLLGLQAGTGRRVFTAATAPVGTSFPSLAVSGSRLFVPEGRLVVSYSGA